MPKTRMTSLYLIRNGWGRHEDFSNTDLEGANLRGADLRGADLRNANLRGADLRNANLQNADLCGADLCNANLRGADLHNASLQNVDLREANLDFSCLPLWCGGQNAAIDKRLAKQFLLHALAFNCDDPEYIRLREEAAKFCSDSHRRGEVYWK